MRILSIVHEADCGPGVFAEAVEACGAALEPWLPAQGEPAPADLARYDAAMSFGGAMHPDQERAHPWLADEQALLADLIGLGTPVLGICLGAQLLARAAGAPSRPARQPEVGWFGVEVTEAGVGDPVIGPLAPAFKALEWHSYEFELPAGAVALARSPVCLQAFRLGESSWGIQFHAEVTLDDFEAWIDHERSLEQAARLGFDPETLRASIRTGIVGWNVLGRALCERFLGVAAALNRRRAALRS